MWIHGGDSHPSALKPIGSKGCIRRVTWRLPGNTLADCRWDTSATTALVNVSPNLLADFSRLTLDGVLAKLFTSISLGD